MLPQDGTEVQNCYWKLHITMEQLICGVSDVFSLKSLKEKQFSKEILQDIN